MQGVSYLLGYQAKNQFYLVKIIIWVIKGNILSPPSGKKYLAFSVAKVGLTGIKGQDPQPTNKEK